MKLIEVEIRDGGLYQKDFDSSLIYSIAFLYGHQSGPYTQSVTAYSSLIDPHHRAAFLPVTEVPDLEAAYKKAVAKAFGMARKRQQAYKLSLFVNGHFYATEKVGEQFNPQRDPCSKRSQKRAARVAFTIQ